MVLICYSYCSTGSCYYCLCLLVALTASSETCAFNTHVPIPRMSAKEFRNVCHTLPRETPIIIERLLSEDQCERICEAIVSRPLEVQLQRRRPNVATDVYEMDISTAIDYILFKSSHTDALWCFQEGLLDETSLQTIRQELQNAKESVFADENWFQYFPHAVLPSDCVILAGEGSTSTLHRDPFEWTGTSVCLEGSKLWRFIEPPNDNVQVVDELLKSYRLPSTAWDTTDVPLSAGWQSDYSLYAKRHTSIPAARDLHDLDHRDDYLEALASSPSLLEANVEHMQTVWSTVQQTGDFLIIPAHWWHQTYGIEPSIAVASQRCSRKEARRVLQHMVDTTGVKMTLECVSHDAPRESVDAFFSELEDAMLAL
jgi:Cupin-like domain